MPVDDPPPPPPRLTRSYNEGIYDLLTSDRSKKLSVHQGKEGVYVADLTARKITTQQEVEDTLEEGNRNRSTSSTKMNTDSSRSHLLLQLTVTSVNTISKVGHGWVPPDDDRQRSLTHLWLPRA